MKLYYTPGACSLSPHIILREAGLKFAVEKVDLRSKKTETGVDFNTVNPKGYVPTLVLDNGAMLTEGPAIVQYLADQAPESKLAPANGTFERYQLQEMLNFISTELHKAFSPLFNPAFPDDGKRIFRDRIAQRLTTLNGLLEKNAFLMGEQFTVADAYLFTVLNWTRPMQIDLEPYPFVKAYHGRIAARPHVQAALAAEGLTK
ncbi:glutathione S-transferase [Myxococcus stipitatus DSM 14675]|uniref:Glutathione S-transferase n=1 Tax=Myxococcus stipitatus (strain DSM 14675 / JCM 12634 / Mx s8) TaxID=1278073 RepID=L7UJE7_MYXSD|nr:glutathione transferase GstA [Myxococcus stipitatus]AGC48010.1 glutathione S-transferase [Myxococcus stipitatus DSM 14675]